jgi:hypothetical protein
MGNSIDEVYFASGTRRADQRRYYLIKTNNYAERRRSLRDKEVFKHNLG